MRRPVEGVRYSAARIDAQIRTLAEQYDISADDSLVAAFARLRCTARRRSSSTVPDMDVSSPGTLTAATLLDAVEAVDASLVFAPPAAIMSVLETLDELGGRDCTSLEHVRLLLSAGAPVPGHVRGPQSTDSFRTRRRTRSTHDRMSAGRRHRSGLVGIARSRRAHHPGCVGSPVDGVDSDRSARRARYADRSSHHRAGRARRGRVRAAHQRLGYDRLWHTTHLASPADGWHATGDIGAVDTDGRFWIGGRTGHVIRTAVRLRPPRSNGRSTCSTASVGRLPSVWGPPAPR